MQNNEIIHGDSLEVLKRLHENSIDSVVTDPPYELGFMGKKWDSTGIANNVDLWKEVLRVLKPGGHLLSFGGTRTYHRMACAIEDAGFEVRDMIEWVYGSGFSKSLNIGKAFDKLQGNEREVVGENQNIKGRNIRDIETLNVGAGAGNNTDITKGTSEWEGWGTALKPAHEPICMARKPLTEKTVAENVLKWGTGGINVDGCRVDTITEADKNNFHQNRKVVKEYKADDTLYELGMKTVSTAENSLGRFPANLIHDNSEEVRECFPEQKSGARKAQGYQEDRNLWNKTGDGDCKASSGNASRFFKSIIYQAKASKSDRNKGCEELPDGEIFPQNNSIERKELNSTANTKAKNNHPTVKPTELMRYLCRLITPPNGTVLDPFTGSGSTGKAAVLEGFKFIGIEKEEEYVNIANARVQDAINNVK